MKRKIIEIDENKCVGCGLCANACQEGAIGMVDGKAKLLREDYCDGLGNCLPVCPTDAIKFVEKEAPAFDEKAANQRKENSTAEVPPLACGCPGTLAKTIERNPVQMPPVTGPSAITYPADGPAQAQAGANTNTVQSSGQASPACQTAAPESELRQWPIQIKLVPTTAPYFDGANLLVAADCTAFAYGNFHRELMTGKITLIGCPKLDDGDYSEKLAEIIRDNNIKSVTVARMEVPCCGGMVNAVKDAMMASGKLIPWQIVTISTDGQILPQ